MNEQKTQAGAQAQDGLGVHLGNPGLGVAQNLADLPHGQLVIIVQGYHEFFLFGQPFDGLGHLPP